MLLPDVLPHCRSPQREQTEVAAPSFPNGYPWVKTANPKPDFPYPLPL